MNAACEGSEAMLPQSVLCSSETPHHLPGQAQRQSPVLCESMSVFTMLAHEERIYLDPTRLALEDLLPCVCVYSDGLDLTEVLTRSSCMEIASAFGLKSLSRAGLLLSPASPIQVQGKIFFFFFKNILPREKSPLKDRWLPPPKINITQPSGCY